MCMRVRKCGRGCGGGSGCGDPGRCDVQVCRDGSVTPQSPLLGAKMLRPESPDERAPLPGDPSSVLCWPTKRSSQVILAVPNAWRFFFPSHFCSLPCLRKVGEPLPASLPSLPPAPHSPVPWPCLAKPSPKTRSASAPPGGHSRLYSAPAHSAPLGPPGRGLLGTRPAREACKGLRVPVSGQGLQHESGDWRGRDRRLRPGTGAGERQACALGRPPRGKGGGGGARAALSVCLSARPPSAYRPPLRARGGASCHPLRCPLFCCQEGAPRARGAGAGRALGGRAPPPGWQGKAWGLAWITPGTPPGRDSAGQAPSPAHSTSAAPRLPCPCSPGSRGKPMNGERASGG